MAGISKKKIKNKKGEFIRYTITYRDVFGKQHTHGNYETLKEAKRDLWKFEEVETNSKDITYGMIFKEFLKRAEKKYAENTYKNYKSYYEKYFIKVEGIQYSKIKSITWQSFFDDLEKETSPHVAQYCLKFAKASVNYAIKHGLVENNVFYKIEKITLPKADINHLTVDELKKVLEECKRSYPRYYALLYTFMGTGAREGEILALSKDDFLPDEKALNINKQFTRNKLKFKPKTSSSVRKIYIFDDLIQLLKEHIKKTDGEILFPNLAGNYLNAPNLRERFWYPLLKLCGITKRVRLHDLRGSYIDMVLSNGLSVKFAQNQAGHSKAETTTNIYARNNTDMINKAQDVMNNIFKKCEHNVSINEKSPNKKIIPFRKKQSGTWF